LGSEILKQSPNLKVSGIERVVDAKLEKDKKQEIR